MTITMTTFKKIQIGQTFEFVTNINEWLTWADSERTPLTTDRTGQFVKVSARKYRRADGETFAVSGSIETPARLID